MFSKKKEKETEENSETEENREIRDPRNTQSYLETIRHESEVGWTSRQSSLSQRVETRLCCRPAAGTPTRPRQKVE